MGDSASQLLVEPPTSDRLTPYDRAHMTIYVRLLDAARDGADWREVCRLLFERDPDRDPTRCRRMFDAHLTRARWMTEHGYRQLAAETPTRARE